MIELIRLQSQEDFPERDISSSNVDVLKTMLCDPGIQAYAHETIERAMTLYRISHVVLRELIGSTTDFNRQGTEWFNAGHYSIRGCRQLTATRRYCSQTTLF